MTVSFRVRYTKLGGHVHVKVWSSEFGPDTTHGLNGTLVFRESEWPAFRKALDIGALFALPEDGSKGRVARVEFVEDANAATESAFDPGGEAR